MIASFIKALKKHPGSDEFDNLYRGNSHLSRLRRENLHIYLTLMQKLSPRLMLVGEAPGYKGCKLTGVPFSSENLLMKEESHPVFGVQHLYRCLPTHKTLEKENSAKMVWEELDKYEEIPLIWNIFPYHPHQKDQAHSNRAPRVGEIRLGQVFVEKLIRMFPITHIAAVGRKAHKGLSELDLGPRELRYLRHPSYGGKRDFVQGLAEFMAPPQ